MKQIFPCSLLWQQPHLASSPSATVRIYIHKGTQSSWIPMKHKQILALHYHSLSVYIICSRGTAPKHHWQQHSSAAIGPHFLPTSPSSCRAWLAGICALPTAHSHFVVPGASCERWALDCMWWCFLCSHFPNLYLIDYGLSVEASTQTCTQLCACPTYSNYKN